MLGISIIKTRNQTLGKFVYRLVRHRYQSVSNLPRKQLTKVADSDYLQNYFKKKFINCLFFKEKYYICTRKANKLTKQTYENICYILLLFLLLLLL